MSFIWPPHTQYVSGPASMYVFRDVVQSGCDLYLFGDVHFSYRNVCAPLHGARVAPLTQVIGEALARDGHLFVEYPYAEASDWYSERLQGALERNASASTHVVNLLTRLFGVPAPVTGMLSKLYASFPKGHPRVHCIDLRSEPNAHVWDSAYREAPRRASALDAALFERDLSAQLAAWLSAHVHARDFLQAARRALQGTAAERHLTASSLIKGAHPLRAAVQALRLHSPGRQALVRFFDRGVEDALRTYRRMRRRGDWRTGAQLFIEASKLLLMDTYAIACMLGALQGDEGGAPLIVYAGDYHVTVYRDFFASVGRTPPKPSIPLKTSDAGVNRCLPVHDTA